MSWGKCRACEAKDREIEHLLALLNEANERADKANARVSEIVAPGVNRSLEPRRTVEKREPIMRPPIISFPGYEREYAPESPPIEEKG